MEKKASLAQLGAGFIQPFAGGTAMAGRAAKGSPERNGQAQRLSLKRWYETVTISKQLDSDRRAAYVPEKLTNVAVTVFGPSDLHGTICQ